MSVTIESSRFGALRIEQQDVIEFPHGLIGLEGSRYTLLDRNPGSGFLWLHSLEDGALALPVVDPGMFFPAYAPQLAVEDQELIGGGDLAAAQLFVTVRATPRPEEITVNLRAPLVVRGGLGYQVLNTAPEAQLQAPLFALAPGQGQPAMDAA